jgi:cytochrome bd-type quinol oxidase subunit 2
MLIQWAVLTLIFSVFFGSFLIGFAFIFTIGTLILGPTIEALKETTEMAFMPIMLPFKWWYDYIKCGEYGGYN